MSVEWDKCKYIEKKESENIESKKCKKRKQIYDRNFQMSSYDRLKFSF